MFQADARFSRNQHDVGHRAVNSRPNADTTGSAIDRTPLYIFLHEFIATTSSVHQSVDASRLPSLFGPAHSATGQIHARPSRVPTVFAQKLKAQAKLGSPGQRICNALRRRFPDLLHRSVNAAAPT